MAVGSGLVVLDIIINGGTRPAYSAGGTCGNVLAGLSYLGWQSVCISRSGNDIAGELLVRDLLKNGVNIAQITRENGFLTPRIVEKLSSDQQIAKHSFLLRCPRCKTYLPRFRSPRLDQISEITSSRIRPEIFFFDRVTPSTLCLAKHFRNKGSLIFFEPGETRVADPKAQEAFELSHVIKIAGPESPPEFISKAQQNIGIERALSDKYGLIIKTLGKYGLLYYCATNGAWEHQQSFSPVELQDCCGAGDWCSIGFVYRLRQLAQELNITVLQSLSYLELVRSALEFGQMLSALSCSFVGARGLSNAFTKQEVLNAISNYDTTNATYNPTFVEKIQMKMFSKHKAVTLCSNDDLCSTCLL